MNTISEHDAIIQRRFPDPETRKMALGVFTEAIRAANSVSDALWGIHWKVERLQLLVGPVIVLSLETPGVWVALDAATLLGDATRLRQIENLGSWTWDLTDYPEYKKVPSRNGFLALDKTLTGGWATVMTPFVNYLSRIGESFTELHPRCQATHDPSLLVYLSELTGQHLPIPGWRSCVNQTSRTE